MSHVFRGVYTIPSTTFGPGGELGVDDFRRVVEFCVRCGAHGLVYPVNASEFSHLADSERMQMTRVLIEQNRGRLPVIVGVSAVSAQAAAKFAEHARESGADGVIAMPPYVRKSPLPEPVIFDYYRTIADAARLPVIIQNYDPPIGTTMSAEFLVKLCREIEHVDYVKEETVPSTRKLTEVLELDTTSACKGVFGGAGGRYLLEEHLRGSAGNMPGCHLTDVVVELWNALESGDTRRATAIYKDLSPMFAFEHQMPGTYKEVLLRRGIIECALKRNGAMELDSIGSDYLNRIIADLEPRMTYQDTEANAVASRSMP